jgi:16S rRNA G966 N2-methylase RsmD
VRDTRDICDSFVRVRQGIHSGKANAHAQSEVEVRRLREVARTVVPEGLWDTLREIRSRVHGRQQLAFDRRYGVDTSGTVSVSQLEDVDEEKRKTGNGYGATYRQAFASMLRSIKIEHERFTFVDIGSGKGAVLLYAAHFPFKRIVGVEYSEQLHHVALRNIRNYSGRNVKCRNVESICMDALEYPIPDGPLVIFLCTPFERNSLTRLVANLEDSVQICPREVLIMSFGVRKVYEEVLDGTEWLERIRTGWNYVIYRSKEFSAEG